jgi:EAL domain-containing protein (putative c-di-GMP-specific phosphodiesterase class I)/GGDEF domain-containing protein
MSASNPEPTLERRPEARSAGQLRRAPGALLVETASASGDSPAALLVVRLNRSDRLDALSQSDRSREVMVEVVRRVEGVLRPCDIYAIASQDELWIALSGARISAIAELAARRLTEELARPLPPSCLNAFLEPVRLHPAVGVGAPCCGGDADTRRTLSLASTACQNACASDGRVAVIDARNNPPSAGRRANAVNVHRAIASNELEVVFQPQVQIANGLCVGSEALIRWPRLRAETVSPAEIVSVAEADGLVLHLTMFVLNNALRHLAIWRDLGHELTVSVNLSAISLSNHDLPALICRALDTWDVDGSQLTLELTENLIVDDEQSAHRFMHSIRDAGIGLALDDFGTGYSSLGYLSRFPVTELKIDQSFVRSLGTPSEDLRIVGAMIELARTFGLRALAEGVETEAASRVLAEMGCEFAQGHLYGRALPPEAMTSWIQGNRVMLQEPDRGLRA